MTTSYESLVSRNAGYIPASLQRSISECRLLIAGCGIGSQVAETAARLGFQHFVLVDGDTVDLHNLNRQTFFHDQVGMPKVEALRDNLLRINPDARVEARDVLLSGENAESLVSDVDLVIDTIDFLDLRAIVALHDQAHTQRKPLISSFSVGYGAAVVYFPPSSAGHAWIRELFRLPLVGDIGDVSYVERYMELFAKLDTVLDPTVIQIMQGVFQSFAEGKPCPAPQIAPGACTVASICVAAATQVLADAPVTAAPRILIVDPLETLRGAGHALL